MVAINFKKEFSGEVERGIKCQTIRANDRKGQIRPGVRLQLYTGMRTKSCRKLIETDPICLSVTPIKISHENVTIWDTLFGVYQEIRIDSEKLARADGFQTMRDMFCFFDKQYGLPFSGVLIKWGDVS